ncbi:GntR family transcriptional regulator [Geminicoccus roseus]|uniref:GntR family transcriptional regulator n=1 Tax=Geminicoccus roseus TaxID=404900 RepID=UPI00041D94BD|nr:GntR family transcriptional regulator [Geminicoccus roseus]
MSSSDPIEPAIQETEKRAAKVGQLAYERFKQMLFDQRIPTGATMTQAELMTLMEVPIGPLREALQILASEGLVTMLPRSGIRIVKPDITLIRNCFQLRRIIECEAVRKYADHAAATEIERWLARHQDVLARTETVNEDLIVEAHGLDVAFHTAMVSSLRNPLIDEIYARTKDQVRLIRMDNLYRLSWAMVGKTMNEHLRILEAVRLRDGDASVRAMEDHLSASLQRAMGI